MTNTLYSEFAFLEQQNVLINKQLECRYRIYSNWKEKNYLKFPFGA